jgi:hypothetical protein
MNRRHRNSLLTLVALAAAGTGIALYAQNAGFTESWRKLIEEEFAKRGYVADVGKLTLGPFQGLVAEDVKFYQERSRRTEIASIDQVILDVDLGRILEKKLSLNSIDFQHANLTLPLDPGEPDSSRLEIENFSARAVFGEQNIEIVHADAVIHGLPISLTGTLHRPPLELDSDQKNQKSADNKTKKEIARKRREQLQKITDRLQIFGEVLAQLEQFDFPVVGPDHGVEIEISGDLADLTTLQASCEIELGTFRRGVLDFEQLRTLIEFNGSRLSLRELMLRDLGGELRLIAEWPIGSPEAHIKFDSSLNLTRILTALFRQPVFGEVVFFQSPELHFEGDWQILNTSASNSADATHTESELDPPAPAPPALLPPWLQLSGVGHFSCDRFTSGGAVFDSFRTEFSFDRDSFYLRNTRLDHLTGMAQAHIIFDPEDGFRYQAEVKFDPRTLLPFISDSTVRRHISRWDFDDKSTIYIGIEGSGPTLDRLSWHHKGAIDLRNCRFNGAEISRVETDFELQPGNHRFQQLRIRDAPPEGSDADQAGSLTAAEINTNIKGGRITIRALLSDLPFEKFCQLAVPDWSQMLSAFRFDDRPQIGAHGELDIRDATQLGDSVRQHNLRIGVESNAAASCNIYGQAVEMEKPSAAIVLRDSDLFISDFSAAAFNGDFTGRLKISDLLSAGGEAKSASGSFDLRNAKLFDTAAGQRLASLVQERYLLSPAALHRETVELGISFSMTGSRMITDQLVFTSSLLEADGAADINLRNYKTSGELTVLPVADGGGVTTYQFDGTLGEPTWKVKD